LDFVLLYQLPAAVFKTLMDCALLLQLPTL
jgi:hypothetical protein